MRCVVLTGSSDGNCSKPFDCGSLGTRRCVKDTLLCAAQSNGGLEERETTDLFSALTGDLLAHTDDSLVDTSGAHVWFEPKRGLFGSGAAGELGPRLLDTTLLSEGSLREFRWGVFVARVHDNEYRVLRFDHDVVLDAESGRKV